MKRFIYLVCSCILLTACSTNLDNTEELYASVIENYSKYTNDKEVKNIDNTNSMAFLYWDDYYDGLYSTRYDVNGDGTQELLISLRDLKGRYSLLDIYTNEDNSLVRLTNNENGLDMIGERMDIQILNDGTLFYKGSAGLSGTGLSIYELNSEENNYSKARNLQETDVNELKERVIDLNGLEWNNIGNTKDISLIEHMEVGDYRILNGKWKNELGDIITIEKDRILFSEGEAGVMSNPREKEADGIIEINVSFSETGVSMLYIPKEYDGEIPSVEGQTRANTERITLTQSIVFPDEVFYRFEA